MIGKSFWLGAKPDEMESGPMQELMRQRAMGKGGPSAAELMMNRGMQQQVAAGRSMAAGARGVSPGLAMRQAGQRESQAMSDVSQQTGIMRAQEQAMAQRAAMQAELQQAMYNASRVRSGGMLGPILTTAGTVGGAIVGGPMGAVAGGALGSGLGGAAGGWGGQTSGPGYNPYDPEVGYGFDFDQF